MPRLFSPHFLPLVLIFPLAAAWPVRAETLPQKVIVKAGNLERIDSIVTVRLPADARGAKSLVSATGGPIPLQVDETGDATFVLPRLAKGGTATFQLSTTPIPQEVVKAKRDGNALKFSINDKEVFRYNAEPGDPPRPDIKPEFKRGGYIHPVYSPSGLLVTDDFPADHPHHHGIWFAWTKTAFDGRSPDFWNMGKGLARVEFVAMDKSWDGPVHAGFESRHRYVDLAASNSTTVLNEAWQVKLYRVSGEKRPYWLFDLAAVQQCAGDLPLKLPEYHYGGLGVRGNAAWNGAENASYLTSEGEADRVRGNTTRGRWCSIGGLVDGKQTGITVLGHPQNFRAPQPLRLHPEEPYLSFAPQQLGEMEIKPGASYLSRYRFVVADGPPDRQELDRLWNDYADPPQAIVQ